MAYKIKNWDGYFENAHSRKVNKAAWLPLPNKMDGKGYRRVVKMKNSTEIFSAWIVILQVASKMPERGVLKDEDGDITAEDLALMSGFPEKIFTNAFSVLISPKISWLECDSTTMECDSTTMEQYVAEQNRTEQKEQKGTEQNSVYDFYSFWNDYDKKVDKKDCESVYDKISESNRLLIKENIPKYKIYKPDSQFRKNPLTYLRAENWNDEYEITPQKVEGMTF